MKKINNLGLELIKQAEGLRLNAYRDSVGILTIGYGHTGSDVTESQAITATVAEYLLHSDVAIFEAGVDRLVKTEINTNQFSALVSFSYNVGLKKLADSTLLKCVNSGDFIKAADQFLVWDKAGGQVLQGLLNRRIKERELFLRGVDG